MARHTIKRTAKVCLDIFLFLLICFGEYAIQKWWKTQRRGFFCNDESLSYPYRESTVGLLALGIIALCVPTLVILVVELFKHLASNVTTKRKSSTNAAGGGATTTTTITSTSGVGNGSGGGGCRLGHRLLQCYKHIGYYLFGLGLVLLATEIPKHAVGRLRPNFFTICQPQFSDGSTCDDDVNQGRYITEFTCAGHNYTAHTVNQVFESFPSGHSSIICYAMLYLAIYLQAMLSTRASKLLKHVLQFVFVMFACWMSLTRITDYWHHWSDVLVGMLLGSVIAIVVAIFMTDLFESQRRRGSYWGMGGGFKANHHQQQHQLHRLTGNSSNSSTAKSGNAAAVAATALPAYTFGTLPYLHYPPQHAHQYSHATYQNYGYVP